MSNPNYQSSSTLHFSIDKNGVANLVFDLPNQKVNKLSSDVLLELEKAINVIDGNKAIRVVLISSAKPHNFIAGADINEIKAILSEKEALEKVSKGQLIIGKLSKIKVPTIALISGSCLGGGLELALACKYRFAVIHEKTILGLPEVNLGIIPGFGGTQRLPKLIGLEESLKIILSGKPIDALKSYRIGLVDEIIHEEFLESKLSEIVSEIITNQNQNRFLTKRNKASKSRFISETLLLKKFLIFHFAKKDLYKKTKGQYVAPFYALEVIKKTYGKTYGKNGYAIELKAFCELVVGEISKNLIEIFFTTESLKKDQFEEISKNLPEVRSIGLLGAGVMGGGIAWLFAYRDFSVRIKDISQNAIALGFSQVQKIFSQLQKIKKITANQANLKTTKITSGLDFTGFEHTDFVVEAVVENIEVKKNILAQAEQNLASKTVIVSNTSSLSISQMAESLKRPQNFAGMHFFNPVNLMPLVEVIRGEKTSDETIAQVVKITKKLGKTPIVVKDVAGFLVNRILLPYLNEAAFLLHEGFGIEEIDKKIEKFGMPMGPFILADVVGIDVGYKVALSLFESYGERMPIAKILSELHLNHPKILGKKSRIGFYTYSRKDKADKANDEIYKVIDSLPQESRQTNKIKVKDVEEEIILRCMLIMINEASRCLEEKVVENANILDLAMIMGAGFPAFRGGVLRYADKLGAKNVVRKLEEYEEIHGLRYKPSKLLFDMAASNAKFYQ